MKEQRPEGTGRRQAHSNPHTPSGSGEDEVELACTAAASLTHRGGTTSVKRRGETAMRLGGQSFTHGRQDLQRDGEGSGHV